jgi:hypothetical protein
MLFFILQFRKLRKDMNRHTETIERFVGPRFQVSIEIEVDTPATERIEGRKDDLRTGPRGVRSFPTIRMEDIERPHRNENI